LLTLGTEVKETCHLSALVVASKDQDVLLIADLEFKLTDATS